MRQIAVVSIVVFCILATIGCELLHVDLIVHNDTDYNLEIFVDGDWLGTAGARSITIFSDSMWVGEDYTLQAKYKGEIVVEKEVTITDDFDWTIHSEEYIEFWEE